MPQYKIDYIFALGKQGWDESWYLIAGTAKAALEAATGAKLTTRLGLTGSECEVEAVRVSNIAIWGDSLQKGYAPKVAAGKAKLTADIPGVSMLLRVEATDLYRRPWLVRGVPDEWIGVDPASGRPGFADPAGVNNAVQAFAKAATTTPEFQLKVLKKGTGFERIYLQDVSFVSPTDHTLLFSTRGNHGLSSGDPVLISRVQWTGSVIGGASPNGRFVVAPAGGLGPAQFTVEHLEGANDFAYVKGGSVHKIATDFVDVTDIIPMRPGTRRTGRALFVPAGRRRAKR